MSLVAFKSPVNKVFDLLFVFVIIYLKGNKVSEVLFQVIVFKRQRWTSLIISSK